MPGLADCCPPAQPGAATPAPPKNKPPRTCLAWSTTPSPEEAPAMSCTAIRKASALVEYLQGVGGGEVGAGRRGGNAWVDGTLHWLPQSSTAAACTCTLPHRVAPPT